MTQHPSEAQRHYRQAKTAMHRQELQTALAHFRDALHADPSFLPAHYELGLLLLQLKHTDAARKQFQNTLTLTGIDLNDPDHPLLNPIQCNAVFYLGTLALLQNELNQATTYFQWILVQNPEHIESLVNLGVIALKHDQGQEAIQYFTQALALDETHLEAKNNLAATFMHYDRFENALVYYESLLIQDPNKIEYHYNAGVAEMALGHLDKAKQHFETILKQQDNYAAVFSNLAAIEMKLNHRKSAIKYLEKALQLNPQDEVSQFMLNGLSNQPTPPDTCTAYALNLFDHYALHYEHHLQHVLNYRLPQHIAALLHRKQRIQFEQTLDLGCGTGLTGIVLREMSRHLTGVDLSSKMLIQAREKGIYDTLIESDLMDFFKEDQNHYDLIIAADVLPYLGDLEGLFKQVAQHLTAPNALFIFSCEISPKSNVQLQDTLRFCHHPNYIQALCQQNELVILEENEQTARQQNGTDVNLLLYAVSPRP